MCMHCKVNIELILCYFVWLLFSDIEKTCSASVFLEYHVLLLRGTIRYSNSQVVLTLEDPFTFISKVDSQREAGTERSSIDRLQPEWPPWLELSWMEARSLCQVSPVDAGAKDLSHPLLISQALNREQEQKQSSLTTKQCHVACCCCRQRLSALCHSVCPRSILLIATADRFPKCRPQGCNVV